jgi:hypothetical protein
MSRKIVENKPVNREMVKILTRYMAYIKEIEQSFRRMYTLFAVGSTKTIKQIQEYIFSHEEKTMVITINGINILFMISFWFFEKIRCT